jgi:hypothetical protein
MTHPEIIYHCAKYPKTEYTFKLKHELLFIALPSHKYQVSNANVPKDNKVVVFF